MRINKVIRNRGMNDMPKNLTVEQKNILSSMKVGAAFAADVAHACITMYVWDDNPKFLYIYHQELPRTQFLGELPDKTGRELRGNEEPLVQRHCSEVYLCQGNVSCRWGFSSICVFILFKTVKENVLP